MAAPIGLWSDEDAARRASEMLNGTHYFEELGLGQLGAASRMLARDVLELVENLRAERSLRNALLKARDDCSRG